MGSESSKCDCDALESKLNECMTDGPVGIENRKLVGVAFSQWKDVAQCFKNFKDVKRYNDVVKALENHIQQLIQQPSVTDKQLEEAAADITKLIASLQQTACTLPKNLLAKSNQS